jgi:hypothetical protein
MGPTGVEKDALGRRRFTRINVGDNPDISYAVQWVSLRHRPVPCSQPSNTLTDHALVNVLKLKATIYQR